MKRVRSLFVLVFVMVGWRSLPTQATQPVAKPCVGKSGVAIRVPPHDEGDRNPAFDEFRSRLRQTVARKDGEALMAIVHPQIKAGFDGSDGRGAFRERYLNNPDEDFWKDFGDVLALGGRFSTPEEFTAPYTFTDFPIDLDAFECVVILGRDVRLRLEPNTSATVLGRLDHQVVQAFPEDASSTGWRRVATADRRVGYVAARYLRSPIDYRAFFRFEGGRWWLVTYLAGD